MKQRIYLDNSASTAVDPRVLEAFCSSLKNCLGNPSSVHSFGQECQKKLVKARASIAEYLSVRPHEIIFTSGGTEGANMILRGLFNYKPRGHIITSAVEHACVFSTIKALEKQGCQVDYLNPGLWGAVMPDAVEKALKPDTRLIALTAVNNETGVKTDIDSIAILAKQRKLAFFVDGVALLGKEPIKIPEGVTAMCFSGHKFHAPKGVGIVYLKNSCKLSSLLIGGDQEYGRRAGTENLPGIIALEEAINLLKVELPEATYRMQRLRDKLEKGLIEKIPRISINGLGPRIANISNLSFGGVDGESLLIALDMEGIAVSHGSACASGALQPSRILLNMGISLELAGSSVRFSLSRFTTEEEIDSVLEAIQRVISRMQANLTQNE